VKEGYKCERESSQHFSEASYVEWVGANDTDKKTGGSSKMLRFSLGVTWMNRIRNAHIRGTA